MATPSPRLGRRRSSLTGAVTAASTLVSMCLMNSATPLPTEQKSWILAFDNNATESNFSGVQEMYSTAGMASIQDAAEMIQIGDFTAMIAPAGDQEFRAKLAAASGVSGIESPQTWQIYQPTPQAGRGGRAGGGGSGGGGQGAAKATNPAAVVNQKQSANAEVAGSGIQVFVIDTGVDPNHEEFQITNPAATKDAPGAQAGQNGQQVAGNAGGVRRLRTRAPQFGQGRRGAPGQVVTAPNSRASLLDLTGEGGVDGNGHGTHVAGTICGNTAGVARAATVLGIKVFDSSGKGDNRLILKALQEVDQRVDGKTPAVVNMSLGGPRAGNNQDTATQRAIQELTKRNVAVVVAAGNEGQDACNVSPAFVPEAITVAASTADNKLAGFSNFGQCTDVIAPGDKILSAAANTEDRGTVKSGTSMASPVIAAAMTTLLGQGLNVQQARQQLLADAEQGGRVANSKGSPNRVITPDELANIVANSADATRQLQGINDQAANGASQAGGNTGAGRSNQQQQQEPVVVVVA